MRERVEGLACFGNSSPEFIPFPTPPSIAATALKGGGTGTFVLEGEAGVHTECQPGSYVFMDADYGRNFDQVWSAAKTEGWRWREERKWRAWVQRARRREAETETETETQGGGQRGRD